MILKISKNGEMVMKVKLIMALLLFSSALIYAQERLEQKNTYIFIDISGSMTPIFPQVRKYVKDMIIPTVPLNSKLHIFKFYKKLVPIFNQTIRSNADKEYAARRVGLLLSNGPWTNIDNIFAYLNENQLNNENTVVYICTDGYEQLENYTKEYRITADTVTKYASDMELEDKNGWFVLTWKIPDIAVVIPPIEQKTVEESITVAHPSIQPERQQKVNVHIALPILIVFLIISMILIITALVNYFTYAEATKKSISLTQLEIIKKNAKKYFFIICCLFIAELACFIWCVFFSVVFFPALVLQIAYIVFSLVVDVHALKIIFITYPKRKEIEQIFDKLNNIKSINLSDEYNIDTKITNEILTIRTSDIVFIREQIELYYFSTNQLIVGISYLMITDYDAIAFQKWNSLYLLNISKMLQDANINLSETERKELIIQVTEDYSSISLDDFEQALAAISGVICGLVDTFFVGKPGESKLGNLSDKITDKSVIQFAKLSSLLAKLFGRNLPAYANNEDLSEAIKFLEDNFKVNYDQRYTADFPLQDDSDNLSFRPLNHHIKSLAHAPDIVGLFFSILDQFTSKASFVTDDGKLIRIQTSDFELYGNNIFTKFICGFVNWLGHCMSDIAGSSRTRKKSGDHRGSGLAAPFFELFQFIPIGNIGKEQQTIAEIAVSLYEKGYDARFSAAASIPILLNEYIISFSYILKQHYNDKLEWSEITVLKNFSFGIKKDQKLNKMLLIGYGCFCAIDFTDAFIRGEASSINSLLYINIHGWKKLAIQSMIAIKTMFRRLIADPEKVELEILKEAEKYRKLE